jgi:hypothetical protein
MGLEFNNETFRKDYTFRNSPAAIKRFPFPFPEDSYMYSVNMEPHVPGPKGSVFEHMFDVDEHYVAEMRDRAMVLRDDPLRCQSLPHMTLAGWDLLELIMEAKRGTIRTGSSFTRTATSGTGSTGRWRSSRSSPSLTRRRCPAGRWNTSPARRRATSRFKISAMTICGSTRAW